MDLPITQDNLLDWFPSPHVENPLAGDPWWSLQSVGLFTALQFFRLIPAGPEQQQALIELRRALDTGLLVIPAPPDEEVQRRLAQTLAPWCPSSFAVVDTMLDMANLQPDDVLLDLGSGDGRVVLAASKRGVTAHGIDIDALFVCQAQERIAEDPEYRRASFQQQDILTFDFAELQPTVITMYLLSVTVQQLAGKLSTLPPGTRIISNAFPIDGWTPVRTVVVDGVPIFLWVL